MSSYVDSEPKHFKGDIIITDPCYIISDGEKHREDWCRCDYGDNMSVLGLETWMTRGTIYGDWSCTTFNMNNQEEIGQFCADAGMVGVFLLEEVLKYNPEFDYHTTRLWTTTLIKDFDGDIQFKVTEDPDACNGHILNVEGHGKDLITGEPIDFITVQTGL